MATFFLSTNEEEFLKKHVPELHALYQNYSISLYPAASEAWNAHLKRIKGNEVFDFNQSEKDCLDNLIRKTEVQFKHLGF